MTAAKTVHHADPCVQVNIWLGKDKEGYTTTSSEGGRLSRHTDKGLARCGHASMNIFPKHSPYVYVSFWPGQEEVPVLGEGVVTVDRGILLDSFEEDLTQEKTLPDVVICLYKLNIEKMLEVFASAEKRVSERRLVWEMQVSSSEDIGSLSTTRANCATFVYSLLKAGGLTNTTSVYQNHSSGRGPKDKNFYKITKCDAGDRAAGIFNGAPWTDWKFTPKALLLRVASAAEGDKLDVQMTRQVMEDTSRVAQEKIRGGHQAAKEEKKEVKKKQTAAGISVDQHGRNALHNAAGSGQISTARQLVLGSYKDLLELEDSTGSTALHLAACFGHAEVCTFLLQAGADPTATDKLGRNILHYAAEGGSIEVLKLLLTIDELLPLLESKDKEGATPLLLAFQLNDLEACAHLIEAGADPSTTNQHGRTVLHHAAGAGEIDIVKRLLNSGCKDLLESKDETGSTPLILAAYFGHAKMCALLLQAGADPSATDTYGKNALHHAAFKGKTEVLEVLREQPASQTGSAGSAAEPKSGDDEGGCLVS